MAKRKPRKLSRMSAPMGIERDYQTRNRKISTRVKEIINDNIVKYLEVIMDEANMFRPKTDSERFDDDIATKVKDLIRSTQIQIDRQITDYEIEQMVQATSTEMNAWNKAKVTQVFKQGLGVDLFISEPWLMTELSSWVTSNVALIKSNNARFLTDVENIVNDGMRRGLRHEAIAKQILGTGKDELGRVSAFRNAKNRANVIGRDQINKLNGQLNKLRQTEAGVSRYRWQTNIDGRERASHRHRDGKTYTWEKGADGLHPGDEIMCRCFPEPILSDLLE